jgi:hypothetical protein
MAKEFQETPLKPDVSHVLEFSVASHVILIHSSTGFKTSDI